VDEFWQIGEGAHVLEFLARPSACKEESLDHIIEAERIIYKAGLYAYSVYILYYTLIRLYAYNFKVAVVKRYH
jgi:hypothetical protein